MKVKARVTGVKGLQAVLTAKMRETQKKASGSVTVGYSAPYAMFVHEAVGMVLQGLPRPSGIGNYWDPSGAQAKFLEQPTRQYAKDIGSYICRQMRGGSKLIDALAGAARILLRESKKLVPVETGVLKASGYVHIKE